MKTNRIVACLVGAAWLGMASGLLAQEYGTNTSSSPRPGRIKTTDETTQTQSPDKFNRTSKLVGMEVENEQGDRLGSIKDIVVDLDKGTVAYVVMSSGGVLGIGEKLLAVPPSAFMRAADENHLILQADKNMLSRAEGIGTNWPSVHNPSFGAQPFWENSREKKEAPNRQTAPTQR